MRSRFDEVQFKCGISFELNRERTVFSIDHTHVWHEMFNLLIEKYHHLIVKEYKDP